MASNPVAEVASTIQSASVKRHPSPHHDVNPSTAASATTPATATLHSHSSSVGSTTTTTTTTTTTSSDQIGSEVVDDISVRPRRSALPPLPDLRFEQSYLASIKNADTWGKVSYITIRDQVLMPLVQGIGWNLAVFGWRYWNRGAKFGGRSIGSRIRRWWWEVNHWEVPKDGSRALSAEVEDVSLLTRARRVFSWLLDWGEIVDILNSLLAVLHY
jgi:Autophagy receptor ATG43